MSSSFYLGIETSCDETSAAVVQLDSGSSLQARIVAEEISSQIKLHEAYGGVVPELASREHLYNLPLVVESVLKRSGVSLAQIEGIGVTRGPGLKGCLLVGLDYAKGLSLASGKPWLGVNHIEGHVMAGLLDNPQLAFPFLCLIVSGGHTELQLVHDFGRYELLSRTTDDAAGEAFDKSANLIGVPYPGGPRLAELADSFRPGTSELRKSLPKVAKEMQGFSFSGLKTAISLLVQRNKLRIEREPEFKAELAWVIQDAIVSALRSKVEASLRAVNARTLLVSGGVSANRRLRKILSEIPGISIFFPQFQHCTDNAAMIAYVAALRLRRGEFSDFNQSVKPQWPLESIL